jgi:hypothetical protein
MDAQKIAQEHADGMDERRVASHGKAERSELARWLCCREED